MKLTSFSLRGYKRFSQQSKMSFDGKLTAIVGPNEVGKTSFLQALQHLNNDAAFGNDVSSRELSRNYRLEQNDKIIEATFLLDESDQQALANVHGGDEARWFKVSKNVSGLLSYDVLPRPTRSLVPRKNLVLELEGVVVRRGFRKFAEANDEEDLETAVRTVGSSLSTDRNTISEDGMDGLIQLTDTLETRLSESEPKYLFELVDRLQNLIEHESGNPLTEAQEILRRRQPEFLLFEERHRKLDHIYSISEVVASRPIALMNLLKVAELDIDALHDAVLQEDAESADTLENEANETLTRKFSESWTQSRLSVSFSVANDALRVQIRERGSRTIFTSIDERSDGLRQFVALLAFITIERARESNILLIDEIETHLHYDAQADLLQTLTSQAVVPQIIYTTHSIGSLPEDLGTGIRMIETDDDEPAASQIENNYWTSERPGFSPLLFGMGASTLSFIPVRTAVVCEGVTDAILWPTIFKEVAERAFLGFQVVPGLSEANSKQLAVLDREAPQTVYLIDADDESSKLERELRKASVPDNRIFKITDEKGVTLILEDLIDADVYLYAVNEELRRSYGPEIQLPSSKFKSGDRNRYKSVKTWCKRKQINPPKKRAVAYRIIENSISKSVVDSIYSDRLKQLFKQINDAPSSRIESI